MKKIETFFFFVLIFLWNMHNYPAAIVFDLDGVLVEQNALSSSWNIGLHHFVGFYNPYKVRKKMFEFYNTIEPRKPDTPWAYSQNLLLPQLMCDWLMGNKTCKQIRILIDKALQEKEHIFSKKKYYELTKHIANFMFSPERLAQAIRPIKQGIELLKLCKGKKHQIYIISNWDSESFQYLYKQPWFKEILDLCNGYIISGAVHMMKPDPCIFEHLFVTYNFDPNTLLTVYIDDSRENLLGAQLLNKKLLHCLECKNKKFDIIKEKLHALKII